MENRTTVFEAAQYISMHEALTPELLRHYYPDEFSTDKQSLNAYQYGILYQIVSFSVGVFTSVKRMLHAFLQRYKG
ncbi:hypothetical protein [Acinetobacter sp. ANC 3813]|uniref:hypothetical protein n=1 Tax=Acinetobacter sp. ANC 3813 TaxID=1977873 RepID=UPI000A33A155|nr:hypothetical protein [Acinetobacter sp. ANC 3813]OTG90841.1 hypothetical protein B9T34_05550 [Acinetobacter sp. ANC 3813]